MQWSRVFGEAEEPFVEGLLVGDDGTLYVADGSSRVLIYDGDGGLPLDTAPDRALGQADVSSPSPGCNRGQPDMASASTLCVPTGLALSSDGTLYVAEFGGFIPNLGNNRVLVFRDIASKATGAAADEVIGQQSFALTECNRGGDVAADSLCQPKGIAIDRGGSLFVADTGNNRVVVFSANLAPTIDPIPDQTVQAGTVLQVPISGSDPNGDPLRFSATGAPASVSVQPGGDATATISGTPALSEIGTYSITVTADDTGTPSQGASATFTLAVTEGPAPDAGTDAGPGDNGGGGGVPSGTIDAGVPDAGTIGSFQNGQAADLVLGQADFVTMTANAFGPGGASLNAPAGICSDGTRLFVADSGNHRVLVWTELPTADGRAANFAIGQSDLAGVDPGTGPSRLDDPRIVSCEAGRLVITDRGNNRALVWADVPAAPGSLPVVAVG